MNKWHSGKPVNDLAREQQVLARAQPAITAWELNSEYTVRFLSAQIEANKTLQHHWMEQWQVHGQPQANEHGTPTLGELREELDGLQKRLIAELSEFQLHRRDFHCAQWITDGIAALQAPTATLPALRQATQSLCSQGPTTQTLLKSSSAWNALPYQRYPIDPPELSVVKVSIPANTDLEWHRHHSPNAAYVLKGELTVEDRNGNLQHFKEGEALAEMVDQQHRGRAGDETVELIVFYAGTPGMALSE